MTNKAALREFDTDAESTIQEQAETIQRLQTKLKTCISGLLQIQKTEPADPTDAYGTVQAIHFIAQKTISDIVDTVVTTKQEPQNKGENQ